MLIVVIIILVSVTSFIIIVLVSVKHYIINDTIITQSTSST